MRLFLAIDLPKELEKEMRKLQELIKPLGRYSLVHHFHLTLAFFGEKNERELKEIVNAIDKFLQQNKIALEKIVLKTSKLGMFNKRVIFLGLEENKEFTKIVEELRNSLPHFYDNKPFHPHITLARVKEFYYGNERIKNAFERLNENLVSFEFKINLKLYQSILKKPHPEYRLIKQFL